MIPLQQDSPAHVDEASLGARLRAARERQQLSVAQAANALRASQAVVEAIERDDLQRLGAPVFVRGYLSSYARLVGMPAAVVDVALAHHSEQRPPEQPLRSAVQVSRSRHLIDRYARNGAYLVLTLSMVMPVIWWATQDHLPVQQLGLRSLDTPAMPAAGDDQRTDITGDGFEQGQGNLPLSGEPDDQDVTVMASLTPFYGQRTPVARDADSVALQPEAAPPSVPPASTGWTLTLQGDSWVEIIGVDGQRLEYGLMPAGSQTSYPSGSVARVALGNVGAVSLLRDGKPVELERFQRANVARFTVSSDGQLRPAGN